MEIVTHIPEVLAKIKPTETLRMTNREDHKKRKIPGKDRPKEREVDRR
jgi:hypothetical protein